MPLTFIGSVTLESSPLEAARRICEAVGMTSGWAREQCDLALSEACLEAFELFKAQIKDRPQAAGR